MSHSAWFKDRILDFVGGTITNVLESPGNEWEGSFYGLRIKQKDGKLVDVIFLSDDEGNAPGSLDIMEVK